MLDPAGLRKVLRELGVGAADHTAGEEADQPAARIKHSYMWNDGLFTGDSYSPPEGGHHFYRHRRLRGARPDSMMLVDRNVYGERMPPSWYRTNAHAGWFWDQEGSQHEPGYRHLGRANLTLVDGRVESMNREEIEEEGDIFWYPGNDVPTGPSPGWNPW